MNRTDLPVSRYLAAIRHRWLTVATCLLVGAGLTAAFVTLTPGSWSSVSQVLVKAQNLDPSTESTSKPEQLVNMDTEAQVAQSGVVRNLVADRIDHQLTDRELEQGLAITVPANTQVLRFEFTADDAGIARETTRAFTGAYLEYKTKTARDTVSGRLAVLQREADAVEGQLTDTNEQLTAASAGGAREGMLASRVNTLLDQLSVINSNIAKLQAVSPGAGTVIQSPTPAESATPSPVLVGGGVLLVALALGLGIALVAEQRDPRLAAPDELADEFGVPVLAQLPDRRRISDKRPAGAHRADLVAYRQMRDAVLGHPAGSAGTRPRVVAVLPLTEPGAGGLLSANLATVLARSGLTVSMVSVDPDDDHATRMLGVERTLGVADVLARRIPPERAVSMGTGQILVVPSGLFDEVTWEMLTSSGVDAVLGEAARSEVTVLLVPPVHRVGGTLLLDKADAVVLLLRPGHTRRAELEAATEAVNRSGARLLGAVTLDGRPGKAAVRPVQRPEPKTSAPASIPVTRAASGLEVPAAQNGHDQRPGDTRAPGASAPIG